MANVDPIGLPQNLYPKSNFGVFATSVIYGKYVSSFVLDSATSTVQIVDFANTPEIQKQIMQVFQDVDTWAQLNPNDVTPTIQRVTDTLMALRKQSSTDGVYDAYELLLFWNMAVRPEYFSPLLVNAKSLIDTYVMIAKEYTFEMLYTRLYNDRERAKNPNVPVKTPTEIYPNYTPPATGTPTPSNPDNPVTPNTAKASTVWTVLAVVLVLLLIILLVR